MSKGNPNISKLGEKTRFSKDNQPEVSGSKGKSITQYLKELGNGNVVEFELTITKANNEKKSIKQKVESASTLNQLIASRLFADALNGNYTAIREVLDRLEGKSIQSMDITSDGNELGAVIILPSNNRDAE